MEIKNYKDELKEKLDKLFEVTAKENIDQFNELVCLFIEQLEEFKKSKRTNIKRIEAGQLIRDILDIAQRHSVVEYDESNEENNEDTDKILFSLGFPHSEANLRVLW